MYKIKKNSAKRRINRNHRNTDNSKKTRMGHDTVQQHNEKLTLSKGMQISKKAKRQLQSH